jgi:hypothetical protein
MVLAGGFVAATAAVACGRTPAPAMSPAPVSPRLQCVPAAVPAGPITVAIAWPSDPVAAPSLSPAVSRLLSQIASSAVAAGCVSPRPGERMDGPDTVVVRRASDGGARDLLDQGTDILVTRDRPVVAYAADRPGVVLVPLVWDRVYVLVVRHQGELPDSAANTLRVALASDAFHADAQAFGAGRAVPDIACLAGTVRATPVPVAPGAPDGRVLDAARILYSEDDSVARFLAERIAVLASTRSSLVAGAAPALFRAGAEVYATGVSAKEFPAAVSDGSGAAYIVAIPSPAPASCGGAGALPANASGPATQTGDLRPAIVPLVETRAWAIVRRDAVSRIAAIGDRVVVAEDRAP